MSLGIIEVLVPHLHIGTEEHHELQDSRCDDPVIRTEHFLIKSKALLLRQKVR
jgi:hypothetical protein